MAESLERRAVSFIVRLWREPMQQQGAAQWRGQIQRVDSGETASFQIPESFLDFLRAHLPLVGEHAAPFESGQLNDPNRGTGFR